MASTDKMVTEMLLHHLERTMPLAADPTEKIAELEAQIAQDRESNRQLLTEHYLDRKISQADYAQVSARLYERIEVAESQIQALRSNLKPMDLAGDVRQWWETATLGQRRDLLRSQIARVEIRRAKRRGGNIFDETRVNVVWLA